MKYIVWVLGINPDKPVPVLCDDIEPVGNGYLLKSPAVTFTHDGKQWDALEWVIGASRVNSFAKVQEHAAEAPRGRVIVGEA